MRNLCVVCKVNLCEIKGLNADGTKKYRRKCATCRRPFRHRPYVRFKKRECEFCGFIPVHSCQLDVDHKNGNKRDNSENNLQTLCANCHRLKTHINRDWQNKV